MNQVYHHPNSHHKKGIALIWVSFTLLLTGFIFVGFMYFSLLQKMRVVTQREAVNSTIVAFQKLFVDKVLMSQGEVSYQDRLYLENAVAKTDDPEIQEAWRTFLKSSTELEAQERTLVLLSLFANKVTF